MSFMSIYKVKHINDSVKHINYVLYIYIRIYLDKTLKHMSRNKKISLKHINIYINRIEILGRI
jgi:hypothetical protein